MIKNTQEVKKKTKQRFLMGQDRMQNFFRKSSFLKLHTTQKYTNNQFTYHLLVGCLDAAFYWQKISKLIVYYCVVRSFEKEDFLENLCTLSCPIKKHSFFFTSCVFFNQFKNEIGICLCISWTSVNVV